MTKDKQLKNEIYKERLEMRKKIFILFLILIPFNVFALTKAPIDITNETVTSLSKALNEEIITSKQLINIYLERINEYNAQYDALITINENAINEAKELDKERQNGNIKSSIHGIPIIVKDNIDVLGTATTAGSKALSDNYPNEDALIIQKLKEAGAIIIAKANMSKFAFYASSSSSDYGTVKNAYNLAYSSYGSSGGSAVSVALNFAPIAIGTDTNASVRLPAQAASLIGYRPTLGLISRTGIIPYDPERDTPGVIGKTIEDILTITNIIKGKDEKDNKTYDSKNLKITDINPQNLTLGISETFLNGSNDNTLPENKEINAEVKNLLTNALDKIKDSGITIKVIDNYYTIDIDNEVAKSYSGYQFCDKFNEYILNHQGTIKTFEELAALNPGLEGYAEECNSKTDQIYKDGLKQEYKDYIEGIMEENNLDAIIYPSSKNKILELGTTGIINLSAHASSTINYPSITIPIGYDSDNLPYSLEIMTKTQNDEFLLSLANKINSLNLYESKNPLPSLYEVDEEVTKLIQKYDKRYNKKNILFNKKWLKKVKNYFKDYQNIEKPETEAKKLNQNYYISLITTFIIQCIIAITILAILLVVKKHLKIQKKRRKPWIFRLNSVFWKNNWNIRLISEKHIKKRK